MFYCFSIDLAHQLANKLTWLDSYSRFRFSIKKRLRSFDKSCKTGSSPTASTKTNYLLTSLTRILYVTVYKELCRMLRSRPQPKDIDDLRDVLQSVSDELRQDSIDKVVWRHCDCEHASKLVAEWKLLICCVINYRSTWFWTDKLLFSHFSAVDDFTRFFDVNCTENAKTELLYLPLIAWWAFTTILDIL